jgi:hypothetical protein
LINHLAVLMSAVALIGITIATGKSVLRRTSFQSESVSMALVIATGLGVGFVGTLMLGIALVAADWLAIWGGLALLALAVRREIRALPSLMAGACRELLDVWQGGPARSALFLGVAALALAGIAIALSPPTDYDSLSYHLRVPQQWLEHGRAFLPADNLHTAFIGVAQCLYLPLLALGLPAAAQVLVFGLTLVSGLGVFALGRTLFSPRVGGVAALIFLATPLVWIAGTQPMVEMPLVLTLVGATVAIVSPDVGGGSARRLYLAAALIGVSFGIKYLGLLYGLALAPVMVLVAWRRTGGSLRATFAIGSRAALIAMLAASPWIAKNIVLFGNPVSPYLAAPRVEPWLRPLYPDLRPVGVDKAIYSVHRDMREPVTPARLFLQPEQLEADVDRHDSAPYLPLVLAPLALLLPSRRNVALALLPALAYVALVLAYSRYSSIRYLLPMLPGLSVSLAILYVAIASRLSRVGRGVMAATMLVLALPVPLAMITRIQWKQALPHALGRVSDSAVLDGYWDTADYMDVVRWTDAHVPDGAPVILLFEGRGFYFQSSVYEDILLRNWAYLAPFANDAHCLAATGARYIVLNNDGRRYFLSRGVRAAALQWDRFAPFRDRCLQERYENPKFTVYELRRG